MRTQPVLSYALKRWIEVIEQYDFEPQYLKRECNKVVDELSCRPDFSGALIIEFERADDATRSLVEAYREDQFMFEIIRRLEAKDKVTSVEFELVSGLLFIEKTGNKRLCVPTRESLRSLFLGESHDATGHFGFKKTATNLLQRFWWPTMMRDAKFYVKTCQVYQRDKPRTQAPLGLLKPLPIPERPGESLSMDFMDMLITNKSGMRYIYVIVDRFSKYARLVAMPETTKTEYVIKLFNENWVRDFGLPKSIINDRDVQCTSELWKAAAAEQGTQLQMTSGNHLKANGQAEQMNRAVQHLLRNYIKPNQVDCDEKLALIANLYNNTVHSATGFPSSIGEGANYVLHIVLDYHGVVVGKGMASKGESTKDSPNGAKQPRVTKNYLLLSGQPSDTQSTVKSPSGKTHVKAETSGATGTTTATVGKSGGSVETSVATTITTARGTTRAQGKSERSGETSGAAATTKNTAPTIPKAIAAATGTTSGTTTATTTTVGQGSSNTQDHGKDSAVNSSKDNATGGTQFLPGPYLRGKHGHDVARSLKQFEKLVAHLQAMSASYVSSDASADNYAMSAVEQRHISSIECHNSSSSAWPMLTRSRTAVMDLKPGGTTEAFQARMLVLITEAKQRSDAVAAAEKKKAEDAKTTRLLAVEQQRQHDEAAAKAAHEESTMRREKVFGEERVLLTMPTEWRSEAKGGAFSDIGLKISLLLSHLTNFMATCIAQQEDIHSLDSEVKQVNSRLKHLEQRPVATPVVSCSNTADCLDALEINVVVSELHTKLSWEGLKAAWRKRFQIEPSKLKAMDKLLKFHQNTLPSGDWIAEFQHLASTPNIPMGFMTIKHYFISRSCPTLSNALTQVAETPTTTELFDKTAQIIVTNTEANNLYRAPVTGPSRDQHRSKVAMVAAATPTDPSSEAASANKGDRLAATREGDRPGKGCGRGRSKTNTMSHPGPVAAAQDPWNHNGLSESI
ncbi:hypothetical protein CBR_g49904 [Chara braunii]|uniref:Integrase catalytic domain-containing protein n=1 Tax=Chara braunii TaxID=69332 RepID=A0A388JP98_CHABU|nr:hypothetical protein CBR_g49904 [Chara braunii]|eukprot:GBG59640.1 hypothetical protein CBR_g49904 [Chara braunii]